MSANFPNRLFVVVVSLLISCSVRAAVNPEVLRSSALNSTTHTLEIVITESEINDTGKTKSIKLKAEIRKVIRVSKGAPVAAGDTIVIKYINNYAATSKRWEEQKRKFHEIGYVGRQVEGDAQALYHGDVVRAHLVWQSKDDAGNLFHPAGREWSFERIKETEAMNPPECVMQPAYLRIPILEPGPPFMGGVKSGSCKFLVPEDTRITAPSNKLSLTVNAVGPSGSGRHWYVKVGLLDQSGRKADPAFCLETSTIGWRTLKKYKLSPLPWQADLDRDGVDELIIWDSFPLSDLPISGNDALVAWVYRLDANGTLNIDWDLSRMLATELAVAYRDQLRTASQSLLNARAVASRYLDDFANERCSTTQPDSH